MSIRSWAFVFLAIVATAAVAQPDGTVRFYGYAYELETNRYIYTELHEQHWRNGRNQGGSITYFDPAGRQFAYKSLDYSADPFVPVFRTEIPGLGYAEGITQNRPQITMILKDQGKPERSETIDRPADIVADSGFNNYLLARFDDLVTNKKVSFRMAVPSRFDTYKFTAKRITDGTFEGKPSVRFRVELGSILSLLADPLEVDYDPATKRLFEYRGVSNIFDPATGKQYVARIAYYSAPPPEARNAPGLAPAPSP